MSSFFRVPFEIIIPPGTRRAPNLSSPESVVAPKKPLYEIEAALSTESSPFF